MGIKMIMRRTLAGLLSFVMVASTALVATEPVSVNAAEQSGIIYSGNNEDVIYSGDEEQVQAPFADPADTDEVYTEEAEAVADDFMTSSDDETDPVNEGDSVISEVGGEPGEEAAVAEENAAVGEDETTPETPEERSTADISSIPIDTYVIDNGSDTLTGVFALFGDEEYTWDYVDSADKVIVRLPEDKGSLSENSSVLEFLVECGYTLESSLVINDKEYAVPEWLTPGNENEFADYIGSVVYIDGKAYAAFTVDVSESVDALLERPAGEDDTVEEPALSVGILARPVTEEESAVSIFRYSTDPADEGEDYYVRDAYISPISLTLPESLDNGAGFDLTGKAADGRTLPDYISFTTSEDEYSKGTLIMPKGCELAIKLLPKHGYQVTELAVDEEALSCETGDEGSADELISDIDAYSDDNEVGRYTLKVDKTIFAPAPTLIRTGDSVVTDKAEDIVSGKIEIQPSANGDQTEFPGSARLEVADVPETGEGSLTAEQIEAFENACEEASSDVIGGRDNARIVDYLDISLYSVVNVAQGQPSEDGEGEDTFAIAGSGTEEEEQAVWEREIKDPAASVTVTLNLDPEFDTDGLGILHQKEIAEGAGVSYEYESVPCRVDEEAHTVTFEADSFSVYAISITIDKVYIIMKGDPDHGEYADTIEDAISYITDPNKRFKGKTGEYILYLGKNEFTITDDVVVPNCVTRLVICPNLATGSDQHFTTITISSGMTFQSPVPVAIDGTVVMKEGIFRVQSLELTRLSVLAAEILYVTGTTTLHGGSILCLNNDTFLGVDSETTPGLTSIKVTQDYENDDSGNPDKNYPLHSPVILKDYHATDVKIFGAITADKGCGLRFGISYGDINTSSDIMTMVEYQNQINPSGGYHYSNTNRDAHAIKDNGSGKVITPGQQPDFPDYLFMTDQTSMPDFMSVYLPLNSTYEKTYVCVKYDGTQKKAYATEPPYEISEFNDESQAFKLLGSYAQWSDASAAVAALNDPDKTYMLDLDIGDSDIDTDRMMTFPKKAKRMIFRGHGSTSGEISVMKYQVSTKFSCDVTFEDLDLRVCDKKGNELSPYTAATIDIAGHVLDLKGSDIRFNSPVIFNDSAKKGTMQIAGDIPTRVMTCVVSDVQKAAGYTQDEVNKLVGYATSATGGKLADAAYDPRADFDLKGGEVSVIAGSVANVANLVIPLNSRVIMSDYKNTQGSWIAPTLTVAKLENHGQIWMVTDNGGTGTSKATVTEAQMCGDSVMSGSGNELKADAVKINDLYMSGDSWVESRGAFDVGNITNITANATLATVQNPSLRSAPGTPFLNVTGNVTLQDKGCRIRVCVKSADGKSIPKLEKKPDDTTYPSGGMALLTAKNGTIDQFVPYHAITSDEPPVAGNSNIPESCWTYDEGGQTKYYTDVDKTAYGSKVKDGYYNTNGYYLKKDGNTFHLYKGSDVDIAVVTIPEARNNYYTPSYGKTAVSSACDDPLAVIDYYDSWDGAVAAVNAKKTKQKYEFIVIKDQGSEDDPGNPAIELKFPQSANIDKLYVVGNEQNMSSTILYTNALTLTSFTLFDYLSIAPVAYYREGSTVTYPSLNGAPQTIEVKSNTYANRSQPLKAGGFYLEFGEYARQAVVTNNLDIDSEDKGSVYLANTFDVKLRTYVPFIGNVSGNNKNSAVFRLAKDKDNLSPVINGSITGFEELYTGDNIVAGDISVTKLSAGEFEMHGKTLKASVVNAGSILAEKTAVTAGELNLTDEYYGATVGSLTADDVTMVNGTSGEQSDYFTVNGKVNVRNISLGHYRRLVYKGDAKITGKLTLGGSSYVAADGGSDVFVTINDIVSNDDEHNSILYYNRNAKNKPRVTITGKVSGYPVKLSWYGGPDIKEMQPAVTTIAAGANESVKLSFPATGELAVVGNNPLSMFKIDLYGYSMDEYYPVKYSNAIYLVKTSSDDMVLAPIVELKRVDEGNEFTSYYCDLAQATAEINGINDSSAKYEMRVLTKAGDYDPSHPTLTDTVITDNYVFSPLSLPAKDRMKELDIISGIENKTSKICYSGALTGYNKITLTDIYFYNTAGPKSDEPGKGKVSFETFTATNCELVFPGKTTIGSLSLINTRVDFETTAEIGDLSTDNTAENGDPVKSTIYAATKSLEGPSLLSIKGAVTGPVFIGLLVPYKGDLKPLENVPEFSWKSYAGRRLAYVPVADADHFFAYGLFVKDGRVVTQEKPYYSYKDSSGYVINDDKSKMLIRLEDADSHDVLGYARSWNEAVAAINIANNKNRAYSIVFLQGGCWRTNAVVDASAITDPKSQVAGSYVEAVYGTKDVAALTMPKASAARRIDLECAGEVHGQVILVYRGAFAPQTDCTIGPNITITTTTRQKLPGKNYYVYYAGNLDGWITAVTLANGKTLEYSIYNNVTPPPVFSSITGSKGTMVLPVKSSVTGTVNVGELRAHENAEIKLEGKTTAATMRLYDEAKVNAVGDVTVGELIMNKKSELSMAADKSGKTTGKLSVKTVHVGQQPNGTDKCLIGGGQNTTIITDIISDSGAPGLDIKYCFTTPSAKAAGTSQLSINGRIDGVKVTLMPLLRRFDVEKNQYEVDDSGNPKYSLVTDPEETKAKLSLSSPNNKGLFNGDKTTWKTENGWYNCKLLTMGKAGLTDLKLQAKPDDDYMIKSGSGVYITNTNTSPLLHVLGYRDEQMTAKSYEGLFVDFADAAAEIDRIGSKTAGDDNSYVKIDFQRDAGTGDAPVALTMPSKICHLTITGNDKHVYTSSSVLTFNAPTTIHDLSITARGKSKRSKVYDTDIPYSIKADSVIEFDDCEIPESSVSAVTAKGLKLHNSKLGVRGNLTADGATLSTTSEVAAANITVKGTTEIDNSSCLKAGQAYVGDNNRTVKDKATDGKISLKDVIVDSVGSPGAVFSLKKSALDKKGRGGISQLTVSGEVKCLADIGPDLPNDAPIQVEIRENTEGGKEEGGVITYTDVSKPVEGMILATAPLAGNRYFRPSSTMMSKLDDGDPLKDNGHVIKTGNTIVFTAQKAVICLHMYRSILKRANSDEVKSRTELPAMDFLTYEEAVAQIDALNRYKLLEYDGGYRPGAYYEDYDIQFADDLGIYDIKNAKGVYAPLPLPKKAGTLKLYVDHNEGFDYVRVRYAGNIKLSGNLTLADGVMLIPVAYNKAARDYVETTSAFNLSSYTLRLSADKEKYGTEYIPIRASGITGGKNSRLELLAQNRGWVRAYCTGDLTVPNVFLNPEFEPNPDPENKQKAIAEISVDGNINITDLRTKSASSGDAVILVGGTGVFGDITVFDKADTRIKEKPGHPLKLNGVLDLSPADYRNEKIDLVMDSDSVPAGTVYASGAKIDPAVWHIYSGNYPEEGMFKQYDGYMDGINLKRGSQK